MSIPDDAPPAPAVQPPPKLPEVDSPSPEEVLDSAPSTDDIVDGQPTVDEILGRSQAMDGELTPDIEETTPRPGPAGHGH
jgi:hypothetical protein